MGISSLILAASLASAGSSSAFSAASSSARLLPTAMVLAQAEPTAPPLVDATEEPSPSPQAEPRPPTAARASVDPYANSINPLEVTAAAGAVLLVDAAISIGFVVSILLAFNQRNGELIGPGIAGMVVFPILGLVASPIAAGVVAEMVAPPGYGGSRTRAMLYAAGAHALSVIAYLVVGAISTAGTQGPTALFTGGILAVAGGRWVGMGLAASYGLHHSPTGQALANRRSPGLTLVSLRF